MTKTERAPIRVLIADDEADVRDAYRQILTEADMSGETAVFHNLREPIVCSPACGWPGQQWRQHDFRAGVLRGRRSGG